MEKRSLSVVIPVYNEQDVIEGSIREVDEHCRAGFDYYEIVAVDDGSSDRTPRVLEALSGELLSLKVLRNGVNRGKGFSVKKGVLESTASLVLVTDADLSTPISEVSRLLSVIDQGFDIAIGSRRLGAPGVVLRRKWHRRLMSSAFNFLVRSLVMEGVSDTQCGFKLFRREAARDLFGRVTLDGFGYDVELLYLAGRLGYTFKEVPVDWVAGKRTAVRMLKDSARMSLDLLYIRRRWR